MAVKWRRAAGSSTIRYLHVAALILAGKPPPYERLLAHVESRLGLVPRLQRALDFGLVGDGFRRYRCRGAH